MSKQSSHNGCCGAEGQVVADIESNELSTFQGRAWEHESNGSLYQWSRPREQGESNSAVDFVSMNLVILLFSHTLFCFLQGVTLCSTRICV